MKIGVSRTQLFRSWLARFTAFLRVLFTDIDSERDEIRRQIEEWSITEQGRRALDEIFSAAVYGTPDEEWYCGDSGCPICLEQGVVPESGKGRE